VTVLRASRAPVALGTGKPVSTRTSGQWVRPSDWLTLTPPAANEQKFVGLIAVFDQGSNYVALRATVSSGTYTVDWGDGSSPVTVTSNTNAEKNYSYSSLSSSTESSRGYRQAIVTVTPTTVGATFSLFGLNYRHSARSSANTVPGWLDVAVSAPNATEVRLGGANSSGTQAVLLNFLEQATVVAHNTTTMAHMFRDCRKLQSVPLFNTASVTNMSSMFVSCSSLQSVPLFNTASVTNMNNMFNSCSSLQSVPLFNTASVTNMSSMFQSCSSLQTVPLFNTASVTNMTSMFATCTSLQTVPLFNTAAVTNMTAMLGSCPSLQTVPLFNTAAVTNMSFMFSSCTSLQTVPLFNTASVTNMSSMFDSCLSLQSVPLFNTAAVTNMVSMFQSCSSLREIPELTLSAISSAANNGMALTANVTLGKAKLTGMRWTQSFSGCNMAAAQLDEMYTALDKLNPNVTNVTATGTVVTYTVDDITAFVAGRTVTITGVDPVAYNLTNVTVASVNVANSRFTVNNAATGTYVSGGVAALQDNRTITVTGNPGTTGDDPTIAENKGWQVTG
jgi:surface protein